MEEFLRPHRVPLPHLRRLVLSGKSHSVPLLLSQIDFPTSVGISLCLESDESFRPSWLFIPRLLPWGTEARIPQTDGHFEQFDLDLGYKIQFNMTAKGDYPALHLDIMCVPKEFDMGHLHDFLEAFYTQGYFKRVSSLTVAPQSHPVTDFRGVEKLLDLPGMHGLHKLYLSMSPCIFDLNDCGNVVYLLGQLVPASQDDHGPLKLPGLQHLVLNRRGFLGPYVSGIQAMRKFEDLLVMFFNARRGHGFPLFQFTALPVDSAEELTRRVEQILGHPGSDDKAKS
ncbi:hypothetical protein DENSPDRAFT_228374 [Dentipellis sp. KUC8613]|nr:hypothetical protein DENSPDRAFT_228374 [Dentipellis sp. KUC8613]